MKKYRLPPLDLFHTFEAVARRSSFTLAAGELCLTQSAVSRQIKVLEQNLGLSLFVRKHRAIELTTEGMALLGSVTRGLDDIAGVLEKFRDAADHPQVTVAASVSFSYFWLMPRLEKFSALRPDVDLRVLATDQATDLRRDAADVAILYGDGQWNGVAASLLFGEKVYPVCSPAYLKAHPELRRASDMLDQTLLHLEGGGNIWGGVDWKVWLAMEGVTGTPVRRGVQVNSYPMVLQAAEAGRGVALGWSYVTDEMIADGRLVCPVEGALETRQGYYVSTLQETADKRVIAEFVSWILGEVSGGET